MVNEEFKKVFNAICKKEKFRNPIELLVGLANGVDLTKKSLVFNFVNKLKDEFGDELPGEFDYLELIELIEDTYQSEFVDIEVQFKAQKTLAEYQHPKRKSIDVNPQSETGAVSTLTDSEVDKFWDKFDDRY